jgi:hypothetical protein
MSPSKKKERHAGLPSFTPGKASLDNQALRFPGASSKIMFMHRLPWWFKHAPSIAKQRTTTNYARQKRNAFLCRCMLSVAKVVKIHAMRGGLTLNPPTRWTHQPLMFQAEKGWRDPLCYGSRTQPCFVFCCPPFSCDGTGFTVCPLTARASWESEAKGGATMTPRSAQRPEIIYLRTYQAPRI